MKFPKIFLIVTARSEVTVIFAPRGNRKRGFVLKKDTPPYNCYLEPGIGGIFGVENDDSF